MPTDTNPLVEHLFRTTAGKMVAALTRLFGTSYIQLAEDIVQDTLITAINHWSTDKIPEQPEAWLWQVAKRKALNEMQRKKMILRHHQGELAGSESHHQEIDTIFLSHEIADSQLRMIFTCCHPSLNTTSQIALTLKTLCGFGIKEVARALLSTPSTINKRLYRAKQKIRQSEIPFLIPSGKKLAPRLEAVCLSLYLLFNEGYNASTGDQLIQKELCLEAMRLTKVLVDHFPEQDTLSALLALMCFHSARFEARLDDKGAIIIFEEQDRSKWNRALITEGILYLSRSTQGSQLSAYHLEAGIAAAHCLADSFAATNWASIKKQYQLLHRLKPNPIILLNLAIIESQLNGKRASLQTLSHLAKAGDLANYYLLPATQGIFSLQLKDYPQALLFLEQALQLTESASEIAFIQQKIQACRVAMAKN